MEGRRGGFPQLVHHFLGLRGQGEGEAVSQTEEFVLLTTEAKWYRNDHMTGKGVPELEAAAASGDEFQVDYVRVYDIEETE